MTQRMQPTRFFITHAGAEKDLELARRLAADLRRHGLEGFLDIDSIGAGQPITKRIDEGLEQCDIYIAILSNAAFDSPWCLRELGAAIYMANDKKRVGRPTIIPILTENCADRIPKIMCEILYIRYNGNYDALRAKLLDAADRIGKSIQAMPSGPIPSNTAIAAPELPGDEIAQPSPSERVIPQEVLAPESLALEYVNAMRPVPPEKPGFCMAATLVSNSLFHCFVRANPYWHPSTGRCRERADVDQYYLSHWRSNRPDEEQRRLPVTNISGRAANAFSMWLSQLTAQDIRLPTLWQWQFAAMTGRQQWLEEEVKSGRVNYYNTSLRLKPIDAYEANPWGIRDLLGNAFDMCTDPADPAGGLRLAGGCYYSTQAHLGSIVVVPSKTTCCADAGFRCIRAD